MENLKSSRTKLVIGGILVMFTQLAITANCFSLFIVPICEDLGFARGQFSIAQSCISLGSAVAAVFSGRVFSKIGIVKAMRISALVSGLAFFLQSTASSIPVFCLINFLIGFANCFGTSMPLSLLITDWFTQRKNMITGVVMMGSGLGGSIFNSLASAFILSYGWRTSMKIMTLIMLVFTLFADLFLLKDAPESVKAQATGLSAEAARKAEAKPAPFFTARNVAVSVLCLMISVSGCIFMNTMQPHLRDIGYSQTYAAGLYSVSMIMMAIGKIFHGMIIDRFGVRWSNTAICVTAAMGLLGSLFYSGFATAVLICIGMMFISSLQVVGAPAVAEALGGIGNKKFFLGKLTVFISLGYMVGPLIYGAAYDAAGSYNSMYCMALGLLTVVLIGIWIVFPKSSKEEK